MKKGKILPELTLVLGSFKQRIPANYLLVLLLLFLLATASIVRDVANGGWTWLSTPKIANIQLMSRLRKAGIAIPGVPSIDHREINLGEGKWSAQIFEFQDGPRVTVLLKPQVYYKDQPEVEWSDIQSLARWKTERAPDLVFTSSSGGEVTARFYRAWQTNTVAVVQWYAWPGGGHHDNAVWYWQDQRAKLKRQRVPWIAVSLHIPIDPTQKIDSIRPFALDLAKKVQARLETEVLSKLRSKSR
jgi:cyanoexosortase B-associated protein